MTLINNQDLTISKDAEDIIFNEIEIDLNNYYKYLTTKDNKNDLWTSRLINAKDLFIYNDQINKHYFRNFRSIRKKLIADMGKANNAFSRFMYRSDLIYAKYQYHKLINANILTNENNDSIFHKCKFDLIGNPGFIKENNLIYNERYLRHCHYINLFYRHLNTLLDNDNYLLFDIGGGYGIFDKFVLSNFNNVKPIIIDLPEQLFNASYYLRCNFPNARVNHISDTENHDVINKEFFDQYDVCLIPADNFNKINVDNKIIITNFNSFGEMSNNIFNSYKNSSIYKNLEFLFTSNRIDSYPTYDNNISILDYELDIYNKIHLDISPLFDKYYKRKYIFLTEECEFSSRCFEFIGQANYS